MNQNKFPFPDRESSMKILQNDPCFGKIPCERVQDVFDDAWQTGLSEADRFIAEHCSDAGFDMITILRVMGFEIIQQDTDYVMGNIRYFCEYLPGKNQICVYKQGIALWAETNAMDYETSSNIILAHEFFHYLEVNKLGWISKRCLVPMLKIGKFTLGKTGIAALSEVAANAFANRYYEAYMEYLKEHTAN